MIRVELLIGLLTFALWVFCLIDVINNDEASIRNLPKIGWLLVVLLFPLAGSIAWLVAGRPARSAQTPRFERAMPHYPEYDRPGRAAATNAEADDEFLRKVRERAEAQRRAYREQQLRREQQGPATQNGEGEQTQGGQQTEAGDQTDRGGSGAVD